MAGSVTVTLKVFEFIGVTVVLGGTLFKGVVDGGSVVFGMI